MQRAGVAAQNESEVIPAQLPRGSYLLAVQQIPFYRDASGRLFVEQLWHKDLGMHLDYIDHLMVAAPVLRQQPPEDAVALDEDARMSRLEIVELPVQENLLGTIKRMPMLVSRLWKAVRRAGTVHSAVAGWPIPMGWIVTPMALLLDKRYVIVVESAPWRRKKGLASNWKAGIRSSIFEGMSQWILRQADLCIFTHDGYRQSMMGDDSTRSHVIPASWIDERNILSQRDAKDLWDMKLADRDQLNILFAGRLIQEKGFLVLLDAIKQLSALKEPILLDVYGEGPLKQAGEELSKQLADAPTQIRMLGMVEYGEPLLEALRRYDAVIVPSISDEQPRIVFDAYSQAVPILASDTAGLRSCVEDGQTGLLTPPDDARALAEMLHRLRSERSELVRMGLNSLQYAHSMTHQEMHRKRAELLESVRTI